MMDKWSSMENWLIEANEALEQALQASFADEIPRENMYWLASTIYSKRNHMRNYAQIEKMNNEIDEQVQSDCFFDANSKKQYKFHFVSSYLLCYVIAGKMDELFYDQVMDYVNHNMNLFEY